MTDKSDDYKQGYLDGRASAVPLVEELLKEAECWLDECRGCCPHDLSEYTGWAERARSFMASAKTHVMKAVL